VPDSGFAIVLDVRRVVHVTQFPSVQLLYQSYRIFADQNQAGPNPRESASRARDAP
jgi:hypothetical protein